MTYQNPDLQTSAASAQGIGATLRAARVAAGRSVEDIASELHMHVKQINALEQDDFEFFPSAAFVKGYLRSYCKIVGIDAQPLLTEFSRVDTKEPTWTTHAPLEDRRPNKWLLGVGTIVVVALLAGLFVVWLLNSGYLNRLVDRGEVPDYPGVAEAVIPQTPVSPPPIARAVTTVEMAAGVGAANEPANDGNPLAAPVSAREPAPDAEIGRLPSDNVPLEARVADVPPAAVAAIPTPSEAASSALPVTTVVDEAPEETLNVLQTVGEGDDVVQFKMVEDCWVELYDSSRNKLLYGLYKTGDVKTVKGNAPFQVFLGFAPGARLEFNGKPFDIEPYTKSSLTARFALVSE